MKYPKEADNRQEHSLSYPSPGRQEEVLNSLLILRVMISLFPFSVSHPPKTPFQNTSSPSSWSLTLFSQFSAPRYLQPLYINQSIKCIIAYINEAVGKNPPFFLLEWPSTCRYFIGCCFCCYYTAITPQHMLHTMVSRRFILPFLLTKLNEWLCNLAAEASRNTPLCV